MIPDISEVIVMRLETLQPCKCKTCGNITIQESTFTNVSLRVSSAGARRIVKVSLSILSCEVAGNYSILVLFLRLTLVISM